MDHTSTTQLDTLIREEISQARARVIISAIALTFFLIIYFLDETSFGVVIFTGVAHMFSVAWLAFVKRTQGDYLWRRRFITCFDLSAVSYAIYLSGEWGAIFYFLYLWVIVGNGMRFGPQQLIEAMLIGVVEFSFVLTQAEYWGQNIPISISLLLGIIILPLFYFVLIKRLHSMNEELDVQLQKATYTAAHDGLTGLLSRDYFFQRTKELTDKSQHSDPKFALLFIDLDGFKEVNDTLGHHAGDELLKTTADKFKKMIRSNDLVARLGGDEFAIVLNGFDSGQIELFARRILSEVEKNYQLENNSLCVTASIGISFYPDHGDIADELVKSADIAMYQSKRNGKNRFTIMPLAA